MQAITPAASLSRWEKCALWALPVIVVLFGGLVELRSAFLKRRMGDLTCYLRAAWAVRTGADLYAVTDDNGWHYNYPPLLAILLVPLADPYPDADRAGMMPFPVSVAVWYVFNVLCLAAAVHGLASALERTSPDLRVRGQPVRGRRWWALRVLPVVACLAPVGHTVMRGQVNLLVLALICAMTAALLRGRSWRAGLFLAAATCIKVVPAFLLVYVLWRRDLRCLAGWALGMIAGMALIPLAAFGPERTVAHYQTWSEVLVQPALVGGLDETRAKELLAVSASASQSLITTLHKLVYFDPATRPVYPTPALRAAAWLLGALLTGLTLWKLGRGSRSGPPVVLALGALMVLMVLLSPVCHRHYFCLALPLVMGLFAYDWEGKTVPVIGAGLTLALAVNFLANTVYHLPGCEWLWDRGLGMYAALLLWLLAIVRLGKLSDPSPPPWWDQSRDRRSPIGSQAAAALTV